MRFLIFLCLFLWAFPVYAQDGAAPYIPVSSGKAKLEQLRQMLVRYPTDEHILWQVYMQSVRIGDGRSAHEAVDALLRIDHMSLRYWLAKMQALRLTKAYEEAEEIGSRMMLLHPSDWRVYNNLGVIYLDMGEYSSAHKMLAQAFEMSPQNTLVRSNLAAAFRRLEKKTESMHLLSQLLRENPTSELALNNIAVIYFSEDPALSYDFLRSADNYTAAKLNEALLLLSKGDYISAHRMLIVLEDERPFDCDVKIALAKALAGVEKYVSSLDKFEQALELFPSEKQISDIKLNRGNIYFLHNDFYNAGVCYRESLWADPDNLAAKNNLGVCYRKTSSYFLSESILKDAIAQESDNAILYFNLAYTYELWGRSEKAIQAYGRYLYFEPTAQDRQDIQRRVLSLQGKAIPGQDETVAEPIEAEKKKDIVDIPEQTEKSSAEKRPAIHFWPRF